MSKARYIMVGGFLGAGKTTALLRLAEHLRDQGLRVGLIANDQSVGLVDTAVFGGHDFPVEEITGGCFCCKFQSLTDAAEKLSQGERPDVFLAEPVGSCTDLTATVNYPLRRMYGDQFTISPYSVMVDPLRAERILGLESGKSFSPKVSYIYLKQLEEAEVIVVNKIDLLTQLRLDRLVATLRSRFSRARVVAISASKGVNVQEWYDLVTMESLGNAPTMEVDYDTYADGEALLGWMNLTAELSSIEDFDGNRFLLSLANSMQQALAARGVEIAHLKMTLSPSEGNDLGVVNLVQTEGQSESSHLLQEPLTLGELIVNVRAESDPELLQKVALECLSLCAATAGLQYVIGHAESFRPGRPVPTHRLIEG